MLRGLHIKAFLVLGSATRIKTRSRVSNAARGDVRLIIACGFYQCFVVVVVVVVVNDDDNRNNNGSCFDGSIVSWVTNSFRHDITFALMLGRI